MRIAIDTPDFNVKAASKARRGVTRRPVCLKFRPTIGPARERSICKRSSMNAKQASTDLRPGRLAAPVVALGAIMLVLLASLPAAAATTLTASYTISVAGLTVGRADVKAKFTDENYAAAINGSTWGISRFVSDARALMAGSGRIRGSKVVPTTYNLDTSESGFETQVRMSMRGGAVVDLLAEPGLIQAADRVPLTNRHKSNVLDPISSFFVAFDNPAAPSGEQVCNRTVNVFDGWQRFDIRLSYKETKSVASGFRGDVFVCAARYVPIAGHRPSREAVTYMANNTRLEVWMAPVEGTRVMVPYRILIGTQVGDLVISAQEFRQLAEAPTSTN